MKMDKSRLGALLCCGAVLLSTAAYAVSPVFAANTADDISSNSSSESFPCSF